MEYNERIEMYKEKARFIKKLNDACTNPAPKGFSVTNIRYEVYRTTSDKYTLFQEWIIIT